MKGYQLTFFTEVDQRHGHKPMSDWVLDFAKQQGALAGTVVGGAEGFDHLGHLHSAKFLELGDQPMAITVSVDEDCANRLLAALTAEGLDLAYVKEPVEYGRTGSKAN